MAIRALAVTKLSRSSNANENDAAQQIDRHRPFST